MTIDKNVIAIKCPNGKTVHVHTKEIRLNSTTSLDRLIQYRCIEAGKLEAVKQ